MALVLAEDVRRVPTPGRPRRSGSAGARLRLLDPRQPAPHRRNVVVAAVTASSSPDFVEVAGSLALQSDSLPLLLYVREIPEALPLGAVDLDPAEAVALRRHRRLLAAMGVDVEVAAVDSRAAGPTIAEFAMAQRAGAVAIDGLRGARGGLDPRAAYILRHLRDLQLLLFSG